MHDAQKMMERGLARRRTNETKMNAESSRSHAVLTLHLESSTRTDLGLLAVKSSRLNLIDLAGVPLQRILLPRSTVPACWLANILYACQCNNCCLAFTPEDLMGNLSRRRCVSIFMLRLGRICRQRAQQKQWRLWRQTQGGMLHQPIPDHFWQVSAL